MQSLEDEQREQNTDEIIEAGSLTLKEALGLYNDAKRYTNDGHRKHWDQYFKVYKGQRVIRNYEGVSDPVIRESHTIIETLVANIAGGNPTFHFVKTNEEQSDDTEVLNEMMDYYMLCNQMALKNQQWVRDMLLYGTGVLHVTWEKGKPQIDNIPLRDFFVDPTSTGMTNTINPAQYAGYEYLMDKDVAARQQVFNPTAGDNGKGAWEKRYKNLDKLGPAPSVNGSGDDNGSMDKAFKDMFAGSTLGEEATKRQIHVIRLYHLPTGRMMEIGNQKEFIYDEPTWCQREEIERPAFAELDGAKVPITQKLDRIDPFLPFAVLRNYIDTSQFYGEGEMALIIHDAELLNDIEAMDLDNNAYQNTPMYWIDPQYADLAPEIETIPGAVYPIPRNAMGAIERPQLSGDLDQKKDRIMQRMRRATAADEAVQGGSIGNSRTTATEVSTQIKQAMMRFQTKIQNLENEGYAQLASIMFKLVQIFVTKKTAQRIVGKNGVFFMDFDPWEFNGEYEAHAKLVSTIQAEEMEVGMKRDQLYQILQSRPHFNPVEVDRWLVKQLDPNMDDEEFNALLLPPVEPQDDAKDIVTIDYKDATPWTKYQMEKKAGFEPDPSHLADIETRMMNQANQQLDELDPVTRADGSVLPGMEQFLQPPAPGAATPPQGLQTAAA